MKNKRAYIPRGLWDGDEREGADDSQDRFGVRLREQRGDRLVADEIRDERGRNAAEGVVRGWPGKHGA